MKKLNILLVVFFLFVLSAYEGIAQQQTQLPPDWIRQFDGIPIHTSFWWDANGTSWFDYPAAIDSMAAAGVNIIQFDIFSNQYSNQLTSLKNKNLKFIGLSSMGLNRILHYTDAKYSVWEAEVASPDTLMYHKANVMEEINNGTEQFLRLKPSAANSVDTLIWGPYTIQDVVYYNFQNGHKAPTSQYVQYDSDFKLKLELNNTYIPDTLNNLDDPLTQICSLQVTQTYIMWDPTQSKFIMPCTYIIEDTVLTLSAFLPLNQFSDHKVIYELTSNQCNLQYPEPVTLGRWERHYIEYKVIWLGNPQYLLSIDKITVSDARGRDLLIENPVGSELAINQQANSLAQYYTGWDSLLVGWIGLDEPNSPDNIIPIGKVRDILRDNPTTQGKHPLWHAWVGSLDGTWGSSPFGVMKHNRWRDFKDITGNLNIWQDAYLFDIPCTEGDDSSWICQQGDYRDININIAALNYKYAYELDPYFGASLQCGAQKNSQADQRNIGPHELMYSANLALMYGAKFLSLYSFFAGEDIDTTDCYFGGTFNAIVDFTGTCDPISITSLIYTSKYTTLRYRLNPRLKGLMGKTLKTLSPSTQHLNINPSVNSDLNLNYIKRIKLDYGNPTEAMSSYIDLGFFNKEGYEPNRYFMIINRYYTDSLLNEFKIDFRNLSGFYNWSLMNYVDSSNTTIIANETGFVTSPQFQINRGDATLFSLFPVAEFGGKLLVNENVGDGMTLTGDMTIENGATLFIYDTYNAKANITVQAGGKIISAENAKIIFDPGKKLIVEGSAEIKGTSTNRLALEFNSSTNQGVVIKAGASIDMQYCDIKFSQVGVATEVGTEGIYISYSSFTNCTSTGILMLGDTQHNDATPIVSNCTFTNCSTGISAANYSEILINQNTVNNAYLGITISSIPSAFVQGNVIIGNSNSNNDGILVFNSGGYIRSNIVQNHINGIRIGNSSPDIGGNILEDNKIHGLYVGSGSIPNLVGHLQIIPPLYFPLSGYNKIFNNGSGTLANTPGNDSQSEIYLSASNIALRDGCNEIRDDRTATPTMNTLLLMNGSLAPGGGRQLDARNNYWGTTIPTAAQFGSLSVIFSPYYGEPCLLPDGGGGSGEEILVLKTSSGEIVDSISAAEGVPENFTTLEASYSEADNYFATGNVELAKPLYEQIVSSNYSAEEKLPAYNKLYTIGNLTGEDENYFNSLQTTFNDIANAETDTLLKKIYNQNAIKCDVSKEEYLTAISKFDNIIQQNPNSEEAVYAEIDIITTALNLDTTNSQLGKMGNGKYLVKGTSDYLSKLNDILQSKFGVNSEEKEQIIPKEYSLYQNYPNPFNPTTTIKFDIPNDGLITLEIFDILGRRIITLIDEYKPAGSYEKVFDASSLASGVYVYKLQAGDFVSSKKMILLK